MPYSEFKATLNYILRLSKTTTKKKWFASASQSALQTEAVICPVENLTVRICQFVSLCYLTSSVYSQLLNLERFGWIRIPFWRIKVVFLRRSQCHARPEEQATHETTQRVLKAKPDISLN